jgi:hypothetical protein
MPHYELLNSRSSGLFFQVLNWRAHELEPLHDAERSAPRTVSDERFACDEKRDWHGPSPFFLD